jgi:hypothetical protein
LQALRPLPALGSGFSALRLQFTFAIAQRDLAFPGEINGLAENPRGLLRRVKAGRVFGFNEI